MDWLTLISIVLGFTALGIVVGWGIGQATCRHGVRRELWLLFHVIDAEPSAGKIRYDILTMIKKLEL